MNRELATLRGMLYLGHDWNEIAQAAEEGFAAPEGLRYTLIAPYVFEGLAKLAQTPSQSRRLRAIAA